MSKKYERDVRNCEPEAVGRNGRPVVPCGLIAWSLFNDTYGFSINNKAVEVSKKDIAWKSDRDYKYGSDVYPKNFQNGSLIGGGKLNESIPVCFFIYFTFFLCSCFCVFMCVICTCTQLLSHL